jgi:hypothetical protein
VRAFLLAMSGTPPARLLSMIEMLSSASPNCASPRGNRLGTTPRNRPNPWPSPIEGSRGQSKIVYTPAHHVIHPNHAYSFDLNHDGIVDFAIRNSLVSTGDFVHDDLWAVPFGRNGVEGRGGNSGGAYALPRGVLIGPKQPFSAKLMLTYVYGYIGLAQWCNATNRYLGLKFLAQGKVHHGWARLSVVEIRAEARLRQR